jgi:membrane fusion protein (multidrug efflux system)
MFNLLATHLKKTWMPLVALLLAAPSTALAQGPQMPPSPVRYTEAREHPVRRMVRLPGTVESRVSSTVASEVAGLVEELLVREGDVVKKEQPLARLRTTSLELRRKASVASLQEAQARLKQAERNLERAKELKESGIISRQDYDDRFYEYDAWQGRVDQYQAQIDQIDFDLQQSIISAPFAGTVTAKRTEVGQWVAVGDPVMDMVSLDELEVVVEVPEQYFSSLNPGARASVTFEAVPGLEAGGHITAIIPRADPEARTFPVKMRIPNREGRIGVGMLAQVSFPAGESYRATVVPKDAVIRRGPQEFVFLVNGDNTVSMVPVETGQGVGSWVAVEGPVQAGQKVVTRGNERLRPGQSVQGEPQEYQLP